VSGCERVLRLAARLTPADIRNDWLREWRAEIACARHRHSESVLLLRSLGAFVHAIWLRWDRWRIEIMLQDLKYALRTLLRRPAYVIVTVLTLAVGIGANAAIFSAVRAVLLRPLPFPQPERLVQIYSTTQARPLGPGGAASPPDFVDWRTAAATFTEMAAISAGSIPWSGNGVAEQVPYAMVTGGFFNVLGTAVHIGRTLAYEDDAIGAPDVVVISHQLWTRRFGSDGNVIGRTITLDGRPRRIVGVMPQGFSYPLSSELWVPLRFTPNDLATQRGAHYLDVVARLKADVPIPTAQAEMTTIVGRLTNAFPRTNANKAVAVYELREAMVGNIKPALFVLLGAVGFVLLIVCVNLASLTLTRATSRTRELAIRAALGAGRGRLVSGLLAESLVVAAAGGVAGLLLAMWATQAIATLDAGIGIPLLDQTRVDGPVIMFTVAVALLAAVLFGTLPAWHASSRVEVGQRIREDAGTVTAGRERQRLRAALIVAETALAVVLLVGAGLLMRTFVQIAAVDLGFTAERVQTFSVSLPEARYPTPESRAAFIDKLLGGLTSRPGIDAAGAIFGLPLTNFGYTITTSTVDGRRLNDEEQDQRSLQIRVVTPDYFKTMGIALVRGRAFTSGDRLGRPAVAIVSDAAARLLWPEADPLGHSLTIGTRLGQGGAQAGGEVVGIAKDVRDFGPMGRVRPTLYLAHAQFPMDFVSVAIKTTNDPASVIEPARALLSELDSDLPMFRVRTMEQFAANAVAQPRLYLTLIGVFAIAAISLAAIGMYGVLAHGVAQRTREIGIRMALGARRSEVVALVVRQAVLLAAGGLIAGLLLALLTGRLIAGLLFGVEPEDPATYVAVVGLLMLIALIAAYLPARRASRINPIAALRYD
jgi:putative ABC transport system permease protein